MQYNFRLSKEVKKGKEEPVVVPEKVESPDKGKEKKREIGGKKINFDTAPKFYSQATEFPTLEEAAKKKPSPKKEKEKQQPKPKVEEEKKPAETAAPAPAASPLFHFTNSAKKDGSTNFSPIKEPYQERAHTGELVAQPRKEPVAREFQVRFSLIISCRLLEKKKKQQGQKKKE
jgi:hypothetical protein